MKKKFLFTIFAAVCAVCAFTACGDDDENNGLPSIADEVVGEYVGEFDITTNYSGTESYANTVHVTKVSDNQVKVALYDFTMPVMTIPEISAVCTVADADSYYTISGATTFRLDSLSLPVSIFGKTDGEVMNLELEITGMEALGLSVEFNGAVGNTLPDDSEDDYVASDSTAFDDEVQRGEYSANDYEGRYNGELRVDSTAVSTIVDITPLDPITMNVSIKDLNVMGMELGDISADCTLEANGTIFRGSATVESMGGASVAISGGIDGGDIGGPITSIYLNIQPAGMPIPIYYSGEKE